MSSVVGIDFSSFAVDLVKLDETANEASWLRVKLDGGSAWDRTRKLPLFMPRASYWDDVYLCAIESPKSAGFKVATVMHRVQGSVIACVPSAVWMWEVTPSEWKKPLGVKLKDKPTFSDFPPTMKHDGTQPWATWEQDALDALGVAMYARDANAAGIAA